MIGKRTLAAFFSLSFALTSVPAVSMAASTEADQKFSAFHETSAIVYDTSNVGGVSNSPTKDAVFTLTEPMTIDAIWDYHWNCGSFSIDYSEQTISIVNNSSGAEVYTGNILTGSGSGRNNVNWYVFPDIVLAPGEYRIDDSHPASWSQNSGSGGVGFVKILGRVSEAPPEEDDETPDEKYSRLYLRDGKVFDIVNSSSVGNQPSAPTEFTLENDTCISAVWDYHWNADEFDYDKAAQTIGIVNTDTGETVYTNKVKYGNGSGRNDVNWYIFPDIILPPGNYRMEDSHPASWSRNSRSGGRGFTQILGVAIPEGTEMGDVDLDGTIDASDASNVLVEYTALMNDDRPEFNAASRKFADVNSDGSIDASDASLILSYYAYNVNGGELGFMEWYANEMQISIVQPIRKIDENVVGLWREDGFNEIINFRADGKVEVFERAVPFVKITETKALIDSDGIEDTVVYDGKNLSVSDEEETVLTLEKESGDENSVDGTYKITGGSYQNIYFEGREHFVVKMLIVNGIPYVHTSEYCDFTTEDNVLTIILAGKDMESYSYEFSDGKLIMKDGDSVFTFIRTELGEDITASPSLEK